MPMTTRRQALGAIDHNKGTNADYNADGKISRATTPAKKPISSGADVFKKTPFQSPHAQKKPISKGSDVFKKTPFQSPLVQRKTISSGAGGFKKTPFQSPLAHKKKTSKKVGASPAYCAQQDQKAAFDALCENRVGNDPDGEIDDSLADIGITAWSFSDFTILHKLGSGACANVYAARENTSGHTVALKIQNADDCGDCYYDDEVDIHETLRHDSIVNMYGYFYCNEGPPPPCEVDEKVATYLCMILELCDGKDLLAMAREAPNRCIDEQTVAAYFRGAIDSLEFVHSSEIIHCDIKPSNFMLHENKIKLADFGMSVRSEEREVIGGSPAYMSPEHLKAWRAFNENFDKRVDLYSLGVVLYELLVGHIPFEVIEDDEDYADYLIVSGMSKIGIGKYSNNEEDENIIRPPVLDLRKLNDLGPVDVAPFVFPTLKFPAFICEEAKDLLTGLMEPCADKRMTLDEARAHEWLAKFS